MSRKSLFAALLLVLVALARPVRAADDAPHSIETRKGPAIVAFVLFGAVFLVHCFQYIRNRRRGNKGMLTLLIGMFFMSLGFLLRTSKMQYAWQFLFTFLAPCAFLATDYIILARLGRAVGPEVARRCLPISPSAISWLFILSDCVTFAGQATGTVFIIIGGDWTSMGNKLAIAGLILQVVSFAIFTFLLFLFSRRLRSQYPNFYTSPESGSHNLRRAFASKPINDVRLLVRIVGLTCVGFMIRSVFRLVEQCDGVFGTIASHEIFFYLFDTIPLLLSVALFGLVWPPRHIEGCALASAENKRGESVDLQRLWK
ncbi:Protein RTM1 [Rhodotorula toruloides]|nr:Protein RTM1 [Rhodotorula toruloides]